eukprot:TRINITY_DN6063_c0_g1_i2.p1 TRINITY_DN6063_c0_g1~~TRINITY_DN6063_c0_g1_i2.p1  ORF type:complete len:486 (-),score=112.64 TRINITY_DN6063_c0_g1_i2:122-1441(-)
MPSPRLQGSGQRILEGAQSSSAPATHRGEGRGSFKNMSVEDMEKALERFSKRPAPGDKGGRGIAPQSARNILEENKKLIQEKIQRKALEKQNSREFTEQLLANDRRVNETDKAKDIGKNTEKRNLAQYYKAKIAEKEQEKALEYSRKVQGGSEIQYFPFVEGEKIGKTREAQSARMREEMQSFLTQQRAAKPPRQDSMFPDAESNNFHKYPIAPVHGHAVIPGAPGNHGVGEAGAEVAPHLQRHPRFLTRAREHMSRRLHDAHVRKALEDKVERTKEELEALARRRDVEMRQAEEGTRVFDCLRVDDAQDRAAQRRKHAVYLKKQIEEKAKRASTERSAKQAEPAGYWGPDEKPVQDNEVHRLLCNDLIKQMEVDQHRRLDSRCRRLRQERRLVDNCMAEMTQDREKDRQKAAQQREVLTKTWQSQQQIKKALQQVEAI